MQKEATTTTVSEKKVIEKTPESSVETIQSEPTGDDTSAQQKKVEPIADVSDYDAIKTQLAERIDSTTTKSLFEKYVMIDSVDGGQVTFVVINKIAEINLKKDATKVLLEKSLSDILGRAAGFVIKTMTKEEYAAKLM